MIQSHLNQDRKMPDHIRLLIVAYNLTFRNCIFLEFFYLIFLNHGKLRSWEAKAPITAFHLRIGICYIFKEQQRTVLFWLSEIENLYIHDYTQKKLVTKYRTLVVYLILQKHLGFKFCLG